MRKLTYITAATVLALGASSAMAQQRFTMQTPADPLYFGLKAGAMDADAGDDASNLGAVIGYKFHEDATGAFIGEGEYTRSFNDGRILGNDWDVETFGAYAGYRSAGPWFWKAKAGFTFWDIAVQGAGGGIEGDDTSFSVGVGAGGRLNERTGVEVEYTRLDSDLTFLSVGLFTRF